MSAPNGFARTKTTDEFPANAATTPPWCERARTRLTLERFMHLNKNRDDEVGQFSREALADPEFPMTDPTRVLRHLATCIATSQVLAAARKTITEYRRSFNQSIEAEIKDVEFTNPERAMAMRESIHESRKITERLYDEDAKS